MHALLELYDYTEFPIIGELLGRFAVLDNDGGKNALEYMNFLKSIGKFPATKGKFYKTIVAGHVGTGSWSLADNRNYHDVFYDGESHYYIDGLVYIGGKLLLLVYNEENGKYYQIENDKMIQEQYQLYHYVSDNLASKCNMTEILCDGGSPFLVSKGIISHKNIVLSLQFP